MRYTTKTGALAAANIAAMVVSRAAAGKVAATLGAEAEVERTLAHAKAKPGTIARVFLEGRPQRIRRSRRHVNSAPNDAVR